MYICTRLQKFKEYAFWDAHFAAGGGDAFAPIVPVLRSSDLGQWEASWLMKGICNCLLVPV